MLGDLLAVEVHLGQMCRAVELQKEAFAAVFKRHGNQPPIAAYAGIVLRLCVVQRHLPRRVRERYTRKMPFPVREAGAPLAGEFPVAAKADHGVPPEKNHCLHFTWYAALFQPKENI